MHWQDCWDLSVELPQGRISLVIKVIGFKQQKVILARQKELIGRILVAQQMMEAGDKTKGLGKWAGIEASPGKEQKAHYISLGGNKHRQQSCCFALPLALLSTHSFSEAPLFLPPLQAPSGLRVPQIINSVLRLNLSH